MRSFLLLFISTYIFAYTLDVKIDNIKNNKGYVVIKVYKNPKNFLKTPYKQLVLKAYKTLSCKFNLPKGIYAITIFHDENSNHILDRNFFHFPTEGYGFSTNPFLFGKPTFSDAEFPLKENLTMKIDMKY